MSLTVDAANLEIMRLDQILEDVGEITDSASNAVGAVETVTNAPMEIMNNVTSKVRDKLKTKRASDESVALGEAKAKAQAAALAGAADAAADKAGKQEDAPASEAAAQAKELADEGPAYFTYGQEGSKAE